MTKPSEDDGLNRAPERQEEATSPGPSLTTSDAQKDRNVETEIVMQLGASLLLEPPREVPVIDVRRDKDTVRLQGQVDNSMVRDMARDVAGRHPDVQVTINDLEVSPVPEQDSPLSS